MLDEAEELLFVFAEAVPDPEVPPAPPLVAEAVPAAPADPEPPAEDADVAVAPPDAAAAV